MVYTEGWWIYEFVSAQDGTCVVETWVGDLCGHCMNCVGLMRASDSD